MLSSIEAGLRRPWYRLRLPAALEARYAEQGAPGSARRIRSWLLVFIGFDILSLKTDLDMFGPEAVALPAALTLGVLVPVTIAAILALRGNPSPCRQTGAVLATSLVAMAVTLNSARIAQPQHADIYLILAALIPLMVGMIAPMSFRHSVGYCGACFALYAVGVVGFGIGSPQGGGIALLVASLILVPLKLTYAQEWATKQSFLLGLSERMQADALARANVRLTILSETDPLTGLANRRLFGERLEAAWAAAETHSDWCGLALVDIDHFKAFNDTAGHGEGDQCLRRVADALRDVAERMGGLVARYGGEEFVVLLPGATPESVLDLGEALRAAVAALALPHPGLGADGRLTASVGVTAAHGALRALGLTETDLLTAADGALYAAKHAGRDRLEAAAARVVGMGARPNASPDRPEQNPEAPAQRTQGGQLLARS